MWRQEVLSHLAQARDLWRHTVHMILGMPAPPLLRVAALGGADERLGSCAAASAMLLANMHLQPLRHYDPPASAPPWDVLGRRGEVQ